MKTTEEILEGVLPFIMSPERERFKAFAPEIKKAMKEYAKQVAEQVRQDCADNAVVECWDFERYSVDKQSILDTEIKTP